MRSLLCVHLRAAFEIDIQPHVLPVLTMFIALDPCRWNFLRRMTMGLGHDEGDDEREEGGERRAEGPPVSERTYF